MLYPAIMLDQKTGNEKFTSGGSDMNLSLSDFWKWSVSDLVSNATRGILAEFIVGSALRVDHPVREEWAAFDLETAGGVKVEVKSAAYMQSWAQNAPSKISFKCGETVQGSDKKRWADYYVFALLHHDKREMLNPMNLDQWEFYVLPTSALNARTGRSLSLKSLQSLTSPLTYAELAAYPFVSIGSGES